MRTLFGNKNKFADCEIVSVKKVTNSDSRYSAKAKDNYKVVSVRKVSDEELHKNNKSVHDEADNEITLDTLNAKVDKISSVLNDILSRLNAKDAEANQEETPVENTEENQEKAPVENPQVEEVPAEEGTQVTDSVAIGGIYGKFVAKDSAVEANIQSVQDAFIARYNKAAE